MNRDGKYHRSENREDAGRVARRRLGRLLLICFLVASFGAGLLYLYQPAPEQVEATPTWLSPINSWVSQRKEKLHQNLSHIKQAAKTRLDPHPQIRFEFYNTLPGMRVSVPERVESQLKPSAKEKQRIEAVAQVPKMSIVKNKPAALRIFDAQQLQHSLDAELSKQRYVVQLGTFKKNASAELLRQTLRNQGFVVQSIPVQMKGHLWYRVQVGPYASQEQAKTAQQKLKSQHLNGLVRQIN